MLLSGGIELRPNRATLHAGDARVRIDLNSIHRPQIDHDPSVTRAVPGRRMRPATNRQQQPTTQHERRIAPPYRRVSGGSFAGVLTGGGQIGNAGQSFTYQFNVPRGKPSLNVGIQLADPHYDLVGFLVDPNGEPLDIQSTAQFDAADNFLGYGPTMQFFRRTPAAGLWTLTLLVVGPVDGAHLREPFTGAISFAAPQISSSGIPNSRQTVLPAGQPVSATINVTNTGTIRKDFFADPRLNGRVPQLLLGSDVNNVPLPLSLSAQPSWLVPPGTDSLTVAAQGTVPITMDISAAFGDPDRLGISSGNVSVAKLTAPEVAPGFFFPLPEATGPFPAGGVGSGARVNLAALARTNPFDSSVSPSTGDLWAASVNPNATYSPLSLGPVSRARSH